MINYEALLEFESALAVVNPTPQLLRLSLDAKLSDRITAGSNKEVTNEDLNAICENYHYDKDYFSLCPTCGNPLTKKNGYKNCCTKFAERQNMHIQLSLEREYWLSFVNNPSGTINTLPCYTEMLMLQQGIPNQLRSLIWKKLVLLSGDEIPDQMLHIFENFQHSYHPEIAKQIEKDLTRTFPSIDFFKQETTIKNLLTILNVYANYDAALGYCQGLLFLVGVLYSRFQDEHPSFTFHALVVIMHLEPEVRSIFTADSMLVTLDKWMGQFLNILNIVDAELFIKMNEIGIEYQVFLYQWWLSFSATHIPDLLIIDRVMDLCFVQGWKAGLFKVSLGLLIANKPIIMSMNQGDEEVIYQHLLNDLRWGVVLKDLDIFFGKTLMSWDEDLFTSSAKEEDEMAANIFIKGHQRTPTLMMDKFKQMSIGLIGVDFSGETSTESDSPTSASTSTSLVSVFEPAPSEQGSIFLDIQSTNSGEDNSVGSSIFGFKFGGGTVSTVSNAIDDKEKYLKELLTKAMDMLDGAERNESVLDEIKKAILST